MYFEEAIKFGDKCYSFYNLARIFYFGIGVEKDVNKAISLLEKAFENHLFFAIFPLASISLITNNIEDKVNKCVNILKVMNNEAYLVFSAIYSDKQLMYWFSHKFIQFFKNHDLIYPFCEKSMIDFYEFMEAGKLIGSNNKRTNNLMQSNITEFFYDGFLS